MEKRGYEQSVDDQDDLPGSKKPKLPALARFFFNFFNFIYSLHFVSFNEFENLIMVFVDESLNLICFSYY